MDFAKLAKEIISEILYITIASVSESGKPWNTPVFCAYDREYNFYWGSDKDSQHSKNIRANDEIFMVIYDSTVPPGTGRGVYFEATASELKDVKEVEFAHRLLEARHVVPYWRLEQVRGSAPIRLYKAKLKIVWMNSEGEVDGHYIDKRVEIRLAS